MAEYSVRRNGPSVIVNDGEFYTSLLSASQGLCSMELVLWNTLYFHCWKQGRYYWIIYAWKRLMT